MNFIGFIYGHIQSGPDAKDNSSLPSSLFSDNGFSRMYVLNKAVNFLLCSFVSCSSENFISRFMYSIIDRNMFLLAYVLTHLMCYNTTVRGLMKWALGLDHRRSHAFFSRFPVTYALEPANALILGHPNGLSTSR